MSILSSTLRSLGTILAGRAAILLLRGWLAIAPRNRAAGAALLARAHAAGDRGAMRSALEAAVRTDPADARALETLADLRMQDGDAEAAHELYARLADVAQSAERPALYHNSYMDPARAAAREPYVQTLREVVLETERCAIFDGDKVYVRETSGTNLENHPYMKVRATPGRAMFVISRPEPAGSIDQPFVLIGTDGGINYGHWLNRNVFKLALLEAAGVPASLPLLINEDLRGYQTELLDLLGIPASRLMPIRRGAVFRCREIRVPVLLRNHPKMRIAIDWLRARLARLIEPADQARDLLYVSRRDSKHHALLNEAEVEEALGRLGFTAIVLSGMPFAEQVRAFSRARVVVGPAGAGLVNFIFSPPHAVLVEITNSNLRHMGEFRAICEQMGMRHVEILSDRFAPGQEGKSPPYRDFSVDLQSLTGSVREIIGGPAAVP